MNPEAGWWGLDAGGPGDDATLPDEIEYMASKSVGFGISPMIGGFGNGNGRADEAYTRVEPWAQLGAMNLSEELRTRLRTPQLDFELRSSFSNATTSCHSMHAVKYHGNSGDCPIAEINQGVSYVLSCEYTSA